MGTVQLTPMQAIKIGIAEDHAVFRTSLVDYLKSIPGINFVAIAQDGIDLLFELKHKQADVVLMDIQMPEMDGFQTSRELLKRSPETKIICLTQYDDINYILEMLKIGVKSFVIKSDIEEILKAIQVVCDGGVYYPDKIFSRVAQFLRKSTDDAKCPYKISENESVHLKLICKGLSSTEIGEIIHKSPRTVEKYRNDLYEKFQVASKEQLIVKAIKWSLID